MIAISGENVLVVAKESEENIVYDMERNRSETIDAISPYLVSGTLEKGEKVLALIENHIVYECEVITLLTSEKVRLKKGKEVEFNKDYWTSKIQ